MSFALVWPHVDSINKDEKEKTMHPAFEVHMLNDIGKAKAGELASAFNKLLEDIERIVPGGSREKSIVITKLEEASFFAKKAMACLTENQQG